MLRGGEAPFRHAAGFWQVSHAKPSPTSTNVEIMRIGYIMRRSAWVNWPSHTVSGSGHVINGNVMVVVVP